MVGLCGKGYNTFKPFLYDGANIRKYCCRHLRDEDTLYRIFYYDTEPLKKKGHNPVSGKAIDFSQTSVAKQQNELLNSIRKTPNMALRLGNTVWNKQWVLDFEKLALLIKGKISVSEISEDDVRPLIRQKSVDMKIGLDIASIAMKKIADTLIIITGDADIVPALKMARKEGMHVGLDPLWKNIRPELSEHVDFISTKFSRPKSYGQTGTKNQS